MVNLVNLDFLTHVRYDIRGVTHVFGVTEHTAKNYDAAESESMLHFVDNEQHHAPIMQLGLE